MSWQDNAACKGADPDLFYPWRWTEIDGERERHYLLKSVPPGAAALCEGCPVASECLSGALELPIGEDYGVRAGTSPAERARMRGKRVRDAIYSRRHYEKNRDELLAKRRERYALDEEYRERRKSESRREVSS